MNTGTGVVHIVKSEKVTVRGRRVLNRRSRYNIHLTSADTPKHSDLTVCGIQMKGQRWEITSRFPTCQNCLKGVRDE